MSRFKAISLKKSLIYAAAMALWLLTSAVAVWEVLLVRVAALRVLTRFFLRHGSPSQLLAAVRAVPFSNVAALLVAIFALVVFIGGFDFHYEYAGKRRSWIVFCWTLGIELALLAFCYFA